jgi:single-strand DNA-binding protein
MGRLTKDPEARYSNDMCITRYTLAVDRRFSKDNEADFIPCVAFGKAGEHAEKYYRKGLKVAVSGRIQTGSYTNRDGQKVYTTEVVIEEQEFAESKLASNGGGHKASADDFTNMTSGIDEELPFT